MSGPPNPVFESLRLEALLKHVATRVFVHIFERRYQRSTEQRWIDGAGSSKQFLMSQSRGIKWQQIQKGMINEADLRSMDLALLGQLLLQFKWTSDATTPNITEEEKSRLEAENKLVKELIKVRNNHAHFSSKNNTADGCKLEDYWNTAERILLEFGVPNVAEEIENVRKLQFNKKGTNYTPILEGLSFLPEIVKVVDQASSIYRKLFRPGTPAEGSDKTADNLVASSNPKPELLEAQNLPQKNQGISISSSTNPGAPNQTKNRPKKKKNKNVSHPTNPGTPPQTQNHPQKKRNNSISSSFSPGQPSQSQISPQKNQTNDASSSANPKAPFQTQSRPQKKQNSSISSSASPGQPSQTQNRPQKKKNNNNHILSPTNPGAPPQPQKKTEKKQNNDFSSPNNPATPPQNQNQPHKKQHNGTSSSANPRPPGQQQSQKPPKKKNGKQNIPADPGVPKPS